MKKKNKFILSISFCYHDSSVCFADDKEILLHLEAERYYRKKHIRFKTLEEVDELVSFGLKQLNKTIDDVTEVLVTKWNNLYGGNEVCVLGKKFNAILTGHHENHIGSAMPSGFKKCVIYCSDGGSEDGTTKLYYKDGNKIWLAEDMDDCLFTGKMYGTVTQMLLEPKCGKAHNGAAGKLMGLAALGKRDEKILQLIRENAVELNKLHFDGCKHLLEIFNLPDFYEKPWEDKYKQDVAYNAHNYFVDENAEYLKKHNKFSRNICMVGGCALNISLNSKLIDDKIYDNVYTSPVATDACQSLGAILFRYPHLKCDYPFLGYGTDADVLCDKEIIKDLMDNKIVSWYQGRSESGARALGHRSFIGLPNSIDMRVRLSEGIKKREPYRPVACMIPLEEVSNFFVQSYNSPYMTYCSQAKDITKQVAPAIVHFDGTTRVQTVRKEDNPIIYSMLKQVGELTGCPIIMNTSYNVDGEPIVDTVEHAIRTHKNSGADELYINGTKFTNKVEFSMVIATYNNNKDLSFLLDGLKKIGMCDREDIEIVVVQNHSDEKVYLETKELEKNYKNLKVFHETKQGKAAALNLGIVKAQGNYLFFTDDDVIITDNQILDKFKNEFTKNPKLGYCSGKVVKYEETANNFSDLWEKKGGLSKGEKKKYWDRKFLEGRKFRTWPMHKMCAGACNMIPKTVLTKIGGYAEFLGVNGNVDGLTLEVGYKIAKNGYELLYNPEITLFHKHPVDKKDIKKKLYYYGKQDTGSQMYIYLKHKDKRYLRSALFGHSFYTIGKMFKRMVGKYPLPISYIWQGLKGNMVGWQICLKNYKKLKGNSDDPIFK